MAEQADPRSTEFLLQLRLKEQLADIDKDLAEREKHEAAVAQARATEQAAPDEDPFGDQ